MGVMKAASVRKHRNCYIFHSWSLTAVGLWLATPPYLVLGLGSDLRALGEALRKSLAGSKEGVPHPTEFKRRIKPLLQLAGAKRIRAYEDDAVTASVEEEGGILRFVPSANRGKEGHVPIDNADFRIPSESSFEEIGREIVRALEASAKAR